MSAALGPIQSYTVKGYMINDMHKHFYRRRP